MFGEMKLVAVEEDPSIARARNIYRARLLSFKRGASDILLSENVRRSDHGSHHHPVFAPWGLRKCTYIEWLHGQGNI